MDNMSRINSVQIIYEPIYRADCTFISELFRFIGIFSYETNSLEEISSNFDLYIYIGYKTQIDELVKLDKKVICLYDELNIVEQKENYLPIFRRFTKEKQEQILISLLEILYGQDRAKEFKYLAEIYVQNDLVVYSTNLSYYSRSKSFALENTKKVLSGTYEQLNDLLAREEYSDTVKSHYEYARIWCKVKANLAHHYQNEDYIYLIDKIAEECESLQQKYKDFMLLKVLKALCYEPSKHNVKDALLAFKDALSSIENAQLLSEIYYQVGKCYNYDEELAKHSYELSNKKNKNIKSTFKLAVMDRNERQYNRAIRLFDEIVQQLEKKNREGITTPTEIEQLFKAYAQIALIHYKIDNYNKAIEHGLKALEIRESLLDRNEYIKIFYGEKSEQYIKLIQSRLGVKSVYLVLSESYRRLLNKEKAEEYFEKLKIWQLLNE